MIAPKVDRENYEKVRIGEFINGEILPIVYDMKHTFTWQGKETICPGVRIVLKLEGYQFNHGTKWLKFNYGKKSILYNTFLTKLVEGASPDMVFDLDLLEKMKVKTIWKEPHPNFQEIDSIFPLEGKIPAIGITMAQTQNEPAEEVGDEPYEEDVPF